MYFFGNAALALGAIAASPTPRACPIKVLRLIRESFEIDAQSMTPAPMATMQANQMRARIVIAFEGQRTTFLKQTLLIPGKGAADPLTACTDSLVFHHPISFDQCID
jgi:hypothetical protein